MKKKRRVKKLKIKNIVLVSCSFLLFFMSLSAYLRSYSEFVSNVQRETSGVRGTNVYVNDAESDYYYYTSQNYTHSDNNTLPTLNDKNIYNKNNLVEMTITYSGTDLVQTNLTGTVSPSENQNKYTYYKVLPVNNNGTSNTNDDYVELELIDNPFANRPNNYGFNGWVTNYRGAKIYLDTTYYVRYAKIPVTYNNGVPNLIEINFNAKWIDSPVVRLNTYTSWANAFNQLENDGFILLGSRDPIYEDMSQYYVVHYYNSGSYYGTYPQGALDENLNDVSGQRCSYYCQYYTRAESEYNSENDYYEYDNWYGMQWHNVEIIGYNEDPGVPANSNIAGYYKLETIPYRQAYENMYDSNGNLISGTCNTNGGCQYYQLQHYYKDDGTENISDGTRSLYYKVTRDTNIIIMDRTMTSVWSSSQNKPFTLTGVYNGSVTNNYLSINGSNYNYVNLYAYNDTRIEYIQLYTTQGLSTADPSTTRNTRRFIFANFNNLKIGRGIRQNGNYVNASAIIGGNTNTGTQGSSTNPRRYKVIVETGKYNNISVSEGYGSGATVYQNAIYVIGNDYDRVHDNNNDDLIVYENLNGTFGGKYNADSNGDYLFDTTLKSGQIGTSKDSYTTGIYVGGRGTSSDSINGSARLKIEGGWAYNVIGGPLITQANRTNNVVNIYMTGGNVESIFGGAGDAATYGNRIISIVGGTVNFSVFGGSNGYQSDEGKGTLNGSTYLYIGGNAIIGDEDNVNNSNTKMFGAEAGSVFGIGNGKTGSSTIGSCDNSNIIINDNAKIRKNVYGGGNYGATGVNSSASTTSTNIKMVSGNVYGSIYGGGNNNGSGSTSKTSTINITMDKGTVSGNIYGGSKALGRVYGSTNLAINGGTVTNVYGGGEGGYTSNNAYGTFVSGNVNITIGDNNSSLTPTITKVYGGSAFGTVNGSSNTTNVSSSSTNVTVNKGNITQVFGGGEGNDTYTPYVEGNVQVTINGGTITDVFGGNDAKGTPNGTINVNINNGTITNVFGGGNLAPIKTSNVYLNGGTSTNVYGGGNLANATTTNVYLQGSTTTKVFGGSNESGDVTNSNVTITSGSANEIYGGNNQGGTTVTSHVTMSGGTTSLVFGGNNLGGTTTTSNVTINGGTMDIVYGGGNVAETGTTNINLNGATIPYVYGGGNKAGVSTSTNIILSGSNVGTMYGGSNESGDVAVSNITTTSGNASTIYGGNNQGGVTDESHITVNGATIGTIFGGGNVAETGTTNIIQNSSTITTIFGGGNKAGITTSTNITLQGGNSTTVYGGSNQSGTVPVTNITMASGNSTTIYGGNNLGGVTSESNINATGGTVGTIYGGNNQGGTTTVSNITAAGTNITTIYGGGNVAETGTTNVTLNSGNITSVYGGGNEAGITNSTNVSLVGSTVQDIFGGSNQSGTVPNSNIDITGGTVTNVFGGNNQGGMTTTTNISVNEGAITNIYGGGNEADSTTSNITITKAPIAISNVYGGGNQASVDTANVTISGNSRITNLYGGSNMTGTVKESHISVPLGNRNTNISNLFGGNNRGGRTIDANIILNSGSVGNIYGGGNYADTGSTNTSLTGVTVSGTIYGGGNQASIENDSTLRIVNSTVNGNVFGGGNLGTVGKNTNVYIQNSTLGNNLFAGGNGTTAVVHGNTVLNIGGTTSVTNHVFGGGNAAATGTQEANNSSSLVNIAGLTCGGNVYGGANTSVLYGTTNVNIGKNAVTDSTLTRGNIHISGTVFGGGEANASGSEIYDFSFISVTTGIKINIDATNHSTFEIDGSIFGSGNASSTSGYSDIYIKNYGTESDYKTNVSIQRASSVTLENSVIELVGATDRTNEYSDVLFSLSRLDEIKLLNNSVLYLKNGTNLVKSFYSGYKNGENITKETVSISDSGNVTRNTNNKLFVYEGKNINIATNENITAYGEVNGMTFFGMFTYDRNGKVDTAMYNTNYTNSTTVPSSEIVHFTKGSYVLGKHKTNHNYEQDGFYTNYPDKNETDKIFIDYIVPTPEDSNYYMWVVGDQVTSIEIDLTASKYSTLGTYELPLINFSEANTTFSVLGFNYNELNSEVELVDKDDIPRIASSHELADNRMALVMKSSDNGWITKGKTSFLTDASYFNGTTNYVSENSNTVPTLLFYLYHSKNLETAGSMGTATISMVAIVPIDDLNNEVKRININVNLSRAIYTTEDYEGTITQGKVYEMFAPGVVNITAKSAFTTYYSLFVEKDETIYKPGYHRVLSSTYNFPENTKITMIDLLSGANPEYYYYVVTADDYTNKQVELANNGDATYALSKFVRMGSDNPNNHYDDVAKNQLYYDEDLNIAEEEFIFIVDFKEAGIEEDVLEKYLLLELRNNEDEIILSVIGVLQQQLFYNLYANRDSVINVDGTLSTNEVYIGHEVGLNVETNFVQQKNTNNDPVIDTNFYDYRSGIKLSILDSNNNVVNGPGIMGISYTLGTTTYYPRFDGTVRINVAERIANVSSNITINTEGSTLASGDYKLLIESFGSPDGIYYGLTSSDSVTIPFTVKNTIYGLKASVDNRQLIVDKTTGKNQDDTNAIALNFAYSSGLINPNIRVSLYRRDYDEVYSSIYHLVDFKDYFTNDFATTSVEKTYMIFDNPQTIMSQVLYLKENLKSGTYKIVFALYDNNTYIGDVYKYIFIK